MKLFDEIIEGSYKMRIAELEKERDSVMNMLSANGSGLSLIGAVSKLDAELDNLNMENGDLTKERDQLRATRQDLEMELQRSEQWRVMLAKERDEAIQHRDEWHEAYIKANAKREAAAIDREVLERESLRRALAFDACQKERDELLRIAKAFSVRYPNAAKDWPALTSSVERLSKYDEIPCSDSERRMKNDR